MMLRNGVIIVAIMIVIILLMLTWQKTNQRFYRAQLLNLVDRAF